MICCIEWIYGHRGFVLLLQKSSCKEVTGSSQLFGHTTSLVAAEGERVTWKASRKHPISSTVAQTKGSIVIGTEAQLQNTLSDSWY